MVGDWECAWYQARITMVFRGLFAGGELRQVQVY